jgi:hypothetical protein
MYERLVVISIDYRSEESARHSRWRSVHPHYSHANYISYGITVDARASCRCPALVPMPVPMPMTLSMSFEQAQMGF